MAERLSVEQDVVGSRPTSLPGYNSFFLWFARMGGFLFNSIRENRCRTMVKFGEKGRAEYVIRIC